MATKAALSVTSKTHKRFKGTLFISTRNNVRIFGVIPFIKLQNDINSETVKNDENGELNHLSVFVLFSA